MAELLKEQAGAIKNAGDAGTTAFELLQQNTATFGKITGNLINPDQPFKEATDFSARQAAALTRRSTSTSVVVSQEKKRDDSITKLVDALDRNTSALTGTAGRDRGWESTGRGRGHRSGAVVVRDDRWHESAAARQKVRGD